VGAVCGRGRGTEINITDTHNNNKCDKYKSSLRHIHDPVLSSLKMKDIRLLFYERCVHCCTVKFKFEYRTEHPVNFLADINLLAPEFHI
jgi:hypothetical protein